MERSSSVASSAVSLLTSRLSVALIAVVFLGVSTRLLTLEEMAVFALYNSFCGLITVVSSLGLLASGVKRLPGLRAEGRSAEASALIRLALAVYGAVGLVWTLLLVLSAGPISGIILESDRFSAEVSLAAVASLCFGLYEASQLLLMGLQRYGRLSRNTVLTALSQRVVSLGLFFLFGLRGYLAGFALGSLAGGIYGLADVRHLVRRPGRPLPPVASPRAQIAYAFPLYADGYLRYLYMHADQLLVGIFLSPASLSIYFVAKRFLQYGQDLIKSLVDPIGTKVAELQRTDPDAAADVFRKSLRLFIMLFLPLSVLLASLSPFLLWVVGGRKYENGAAPLALLFLSLFFFAVFSHLSTFVFILGAPRERFRSNLVSAAAQAAAMIALMPAFALHGLAISRSLGFGIASLHARGRLAGLAPWLGRAGAGRATLGVLAPTLLMAGIILVPYHLTDQLLLLPILAVPAVMIALAIVLVFVLGPGERRDLARMVPGRGGMARTLRTALLPGEGEGM